LYSASCPTTNGTKAGFTRFSRGSLLLSNMVVLFWVHDNSFPPEEISTFALM
jgi:hypothetical protein